MSQKIPYLGDFELRVLQLVWENEPCMERQISDLVMKERPVARTTVLKCWVLRSSKERNDPRASRGHSDTESVGRYRTLTVKAGDAVEDVDFAIRGVPRFTGRVLLPDGTPAANVPVLAMIHWSHSNTEDAERIAEARSRLEARVKAGAEAPPPAKAGGGTIIHVSEFGMGKDFRLQTDDAGRFQGYLRRPEYGRSDADDAIDIVLVVRTGDKGLAAFQVMASNHPHAN